ncbi:MAG: tyrosine decarboxylase, partial [Candidatus Eremiobacteraeota bacterium]|nr:tyrosine decarboxylase [Candidatus Eremiobacteraeota bacterium]
MNALFLGPKSENRKFFKEMLEFVMDEHIHWRRDFHPSDRPVVSPQEQRSAPYQDTLVRTEEVLLELSSRLKASSIPAFSPRYLGHMVSDTLMAANLGYLATILYNPNNCSFDASSASTMLELEVGQDLCRLFGFEPTEGWGHITAGGTIANYEALWVARNLKSLVRAIEMTRPDLLQGYDGTRRANLPVGEALTLLARVKAEGLLDTVRRQTVQYRGTGPGLGKLIVPESKHYSWTKAADILGLGQDSLVDIPVGDDFRMDIQALRTIVERMVQDGTPILGVVAVVGTTEVGAVDPVHEIVALRQQLE